MGQQTGKNTVTLVASRKGKLPHSSQEVANRFIKFYRFLNNSASPGLTTLGEGNLKAIRQYLEESKIPRLTQGKGQLLDTPDGKGIATTKPHRAPGPDGFSLLYYKTFASTLYQPFLQRFIALCDTHYFLLDTLRVTITVIPQEGKDRTQCASYHLISLLNVDLKLFTKILGSRL